MSWSLRRDVTTWRDGHFGLGENMTPWLQTGEALLGDDEPKKEAGIFAILK